MRPNSPARHGPAPRSMFLPPNSGRNPTLPYQTTFDRRLTNSADGHGTDLSVKCRELRTTNNVKIWRILRQLEGAFVCVNRTKSNHQNSQSVKAATKLKSFAFSSRLLGESPAQDSPRSREEREDSAKKNRFLLAKDLRVSSAFMNAGGVTGNWLGMYC